jgi:hypothetical protein
VLPEPPLPLLPVLPVGEGRQRDRAPDQRYRHPCGADQPPDSPSFHATGT